MRRLEAVESSRASLPSPSDLLLYESEKQQQKYRKKTVNDVVALNSFSFSFLPAADYMPRAEINKKINREKCQVSASKAEKNYGEFSSFSR